MIDMDFSEWWYLGKPEERERYRRATGRHSLISKIDARAEAVLADVKRKSVQKRRKRSRKRNRTFGKQHRTFKT